MPTTTLRGDLLPELRSYLPEADDLFLGVLDPDDYLTHVETYASLRRHDAHLPDALLEQFVSGLVLHLERPAALA